MGRGHGGYVRKAQSYVDSGGQKVTDKGTIFIAERYIDLGYESVFRRRKEEKTYDLTIKTSDDVGYVKNIEVKMILSNKSSQVATQIKHARDQIGEGDTVALYFPNHSNCATARKLAKDGVDEARRKGDIKGPIEVWFSDKTRIEF
jgi:hypothetical protein